MPTKTEEYLQKYVYKNSGTNSNDYANEQIEKQEPKQNTGYQFGSILSTIGDIFGDIKVGIGKSVEGIVDYGLGAIGSLAGVFGATNLEDALARAVEYDVTGNTIGKVDDFLGQRSLINNDNKISKIIHGVGQGVGGMLPAIAVSLATGGASLGSQIASSATFGLGAAGQSTEEALNEGASLKQATAYGTLSGATEVAIEGISGKLGGTNVLTSKGLGKIFGSGFGKVAKTFAEEGTEEVVSDFLNPLWKKITYSGKYETPEMSELLESFTVGGLTALAMGGSAKAIDVAKYGVDGSKANSIINQISELNAEEYNLERNNKLNSDLSAQYAEKRLKLVNELGNQLSKMDTDSKKYTKLTVDNNIDAISNFNAKKQVVYEAVDSMNKKYGTDLKIEFQDSKTISGGNNSLKIDGYIDNKTNTIVINEQSVDPYSVILAHEITHSTENNALYKEISNDILSSMSKEQLDASYENLKKLYGKATSTEQLNKEIVANYMGKALGSNSKTILNTFAKKPNVVSKVINWLDSKLSKNSVNNAEKQELNNIRNKMQNLLQSKKLESGNNLDVKYKRGVINVNINTNGIPKNLPKQKYSSIVNQIQNRLYELHQTESYLENTLITFSDTNDLTFVKYSSLDKETNVITNSEIEYIEIDDYCSSIGLNPINAENIMLRVKEMIRDVYKRGNDCKPNDFRKYRQLARKEELQHLGSKFSSNASKQQEIVEANSRESTNVGERIFKDSGENESGEKESIEYKKSSNSDITTQQEKSVDEVIDETKDKVQTQVPRTNKNIIDTIKNGEAKEALKKAIEHRDDYVTSLKIQFTNALAGIEEEIKKVYQSKNNDVDVKKSKEKTNAMMRQFKAKADKAMRASSVANQVIGTKLNDIWSPIIKKGTNYANDFETYLLHVHNVNRMNFKFLDPDIYNNLTRIAERGKLEPADIKYLNKLVDDKKIKKSDVNKIVKNGELDAQNLDMILEECKEIQEKPVFGKEYTADMSKKAAQELLNRHPEFSEYAQKVYGYLNDLNKLRLESGIINQNQLDFMEEAYKGTYVPTYRVSKSGATTLGITGSKNVGVAKSMYKAKGSESDIQSIMVSMSQQTMGAYKQAALNELFAEVKKELPNSFEITEKNRSNRDDIEGNVNPKSNTIFFYEDGKRVTYNTTKEIALGFESLRGNSGRENAVFKTTSKLVSMLKKWTTEYNPFFAVRNLFRDASDAFIYTKYGKNLFKRYAETLKEIKSNGKYYQMYLENGGLAYSFFDQEYGIDLRKQNFLIEKISKINEITELIPRLSEFMESMKASEGKNDAFGKPLTDKQRVELAMYDASEVTVNFARGGTATKWLNRNLMPYLNASVQGWCKTWNTFVHPESLRAWGLSIGKVVMASLPTILLNEIMLGDDDDYEKLDDSIKGGYFLIKLKNNKFIRIPRGRVEAVMGDAMQRLYRTAKGEKGAFDSYASDTLINISPIENMSRTILSPINDVRTNTTWYGGNIENSAMKNLPVKERYDNNTSEIAKILSKLTPSISPKKWHYLLDQYSGVLGDVVLPLTSKNKSDIKNITGLTTDSLKNNKYTTRYYDKAEELKQNKSSSNGTAVDKAKYRYFNKMNTKISELYKQIKNSTDDEEITATRLLITNLQKQTLENIEIFGEVLEKYEYGLGIEELYDDYYIEATRECFGAETALMDYNKKVYEKASIFNKCGIDWDTVYCAYFDAQEINSDYDENGNAINGSKKEKVIKYVKSLNLTATQKYMIMGLLGYKNANGKEQVQNLLKSKGYSGEELKEIMKICGYQD